VLLAIVTGLWMVAPAGLVGAPHGGDSAAAAGPVTPPAALTTLPANLRIGHLGPASHHPYASPLFYTQIGSTLTEVNGSDVIDSVPSLSEEIPLVPSAFSLLSQTGIGYELNGVSTTGDWYQIVVGYDWPGCGSGFQLITEIWDNQGNSGPVNCPGTITLSKGDTVRLTLAIPSSKQACLTIADLRTKASVPACVTQDDKGATGFELLSTNADSNGYYTGTMTEIVNQTATSCPHYTDLPTVTFDFPPWENFTEYIAWSDERDVNSGLQCYSGGTGVDALSAGDPSSHFFDSTGGSQYGPHYIEAQNDTLLNSTVSFRFQTDVVVLNPVTVNASSLTPSVGDVLSLHAVPDGGGVAPYGRTIWQLNGTLLPFPNPWWNWTVNGSGNYTVEAFLVDHSGDVSEGSVPVVIRVPFPLWVGPVRTVGRSAADVGQTIVLSGRAGGGIGWVSYSWSGLPAGCVSANVSTLSCAPKVAGTFTVQLTVHDASGAQRDSSGISFVVSTDPAVTVRGDHALADIGQTVTFEALASGGTGIYQYEWHNLLQGCVPTASFATCNVTLEGSYQVGVAVTDSNGFTTPSPTLGFVAFLAPNVTLAANRPTVDAGASLSVTATVVGGAGGLSYRWEGLPNGCVGEDDSLVQCTPLETGSSRVTVTVTDQANGTATSSSYAIDVVPALTLTLRASPPSTTAPGNITLLGVPAGGSALRTEKWRGLPTGCPNPSGLSVGCEGVPAGNYTVMLTVTDVGGGSTTAQVLVSVLPPPPPPNGGNSTVFGGSSETTLAVIGVVVVVAVAAVVMYWRPGKRSAAPAPTPPESAGPGYR
jgi:hypothetical protein